MTQVAATRSGGGSLGPYTSALGIAANVDDFACVGWDDCVEVYLSSTASIELTGFYAVPGRVALCRVLTNTGVNNITLKAQNTSSLAANRLAGADVVLAPDTSATLVYDYAAARWRAVTVPSTGGGASTLVEVVRIWFNGQGALVAVGTVTGFFRVPYNGAITKATILGDVSGSAVVDIKKGTYSAFPTLTSICASAKPTLSSAQKAENTSLTGWTTAVAAGDVLSAVVESCAGITRLDVLLEITRS